MTARVSNLTDHQRAVAERIEARRVELDIPQTRVAELCQFDRTTAYKKRDMLIPWSYKEITALAPALNMTVNELMNGKGVFLDDRQEALVSDSLTYALKTMQARGLSCEDFSAEDLGALFTEFLIRALKDNGVDHHSVDRMLGLIRRKP